MLMSMGESIDTDVYFCKTPLSKCGVYGSAMRDNPLDILKRNLNAALEAKGVSIHALANRDPKKQRTYDRIFKAETTPNLATLVTICDSLGIEPWEALCPWFRAGKKQTTKPLDRDLLQRSVRAAFGMVEVNQLPPEPDRITRFTLLCYDEGNTANTKVVETPPSDLRQPNRAPNDEVIHDGRTNKPPTTRGMAGEGADRTTRGDEPKTARTYRAARKTV